MISKLGDILRLLLRQCSNTNVKDSSTAHSRSCFSAHILTSIKSLITAAYAPFIWQCLLFSIKSVHRSALNIYLQVLHLQTFCYEMRLRKHQSSCPVCNASAHALAQSISCDLCSNWTHVKCTNGEITPSMYLRATKGDTDIQFVVLAVDLCHETVHSTRARD